MSIRHELADVLRPLLPAGWRIVPYERDIDPPSATVVMIRQKRLRFDERAGRLVAVLILSIISPHTDDTAAAEDALDDGVNDLLDALLRVAEVRIPSATKTRFGKVKYAAWDIDVEAIIERKL